MINLLSTTRKAEVRAARVNVLLLRYIIILILAIVFIVGALYVSYTVLQQTMASADSRIESNEQQGEIYKDTQDQINTLSTRLNDANTALQEQSSYGTLLTTLGQLMPQGTVLDSLVLDAQTLSGTPVDIIAYAESDTKAVAIQQNLQSSPLFTSVSPKGTSPTEGIPGYPVKVTLTVSFNPRSI